MLVQSFIENRLQTGWGSQVSLKLPGSLCGNFRTGIRKPVGKQEIIDAKPSSYRATEALSSISAGRQFSYLYYHKAGLSMGLPPDFAAKSVRSIPSIKLVSWVKAEA